MSTNRLADEAAVHARSLDLGRALSMNAAARRFVLGTLAIALLDARTFAIVQARYLPASPLPMMRIFTIKLLKLVGSCERCCYGQKLLTNASCWRIQFTSSPS